MANLSLSKNACVILGVFSANAMRSLTINSVYDKVTELQSTGIPLFNGMSLASCFDATLELHEKGLITKKAQNEYWLSVLGKEALEIKE